MTVLLTSPNPFHRKAEHKKVGEREREREREGRERRRAH